MLCGDKGEALENRPRVFTMSMFKQLRVHSNVGGFFNSNRCNAEAGGLLRVQGLPGLHSELKSVWTS